MDVKKGYKQSEIGVIPEDWEIKELSKVGSFYKGSGVTRQQSNSGQIPCVRYGELYTKHDIYIRNFTSFISEEVSKTAKQIKKGDVLFAASGETKEEIGKCAVNMSKRKAFAGGDIVILSPYKEQDALFLSYVLNTDFAKHQKAQYGQGDAIVHITTDSLKKLIIPCPPRDEQINISNALRAIDELIHFYEKKITKKKNIKLTLQDELLSGKRRLKGYSDEWLNVTLSEGLTYKTGYPFPSDKFNKHQGIRLIRNRDLKSDDQIILYNGEYSTDFIIQDGDILVGMDGEFTPFLWNKGNALLNQRVGKVEVQGKWYSKFIYYSLLKPLESIQSSTGATTVKHLSHSDVENIQISIPQTLEEQKAIADCLYDFDIEVKVLEQQKTKYLNLKSAMMEQLLTGQIRIKS